MRLGVEVLTLALFLFMVQEWLRRRSSRVAWGLFFALPVLLTPAWMLGDAAPLCRQFDTPYFFCWLKTCSVSISACWFTGLRFLPLQHRRWAQYVSFLILPVNMLQAIFLDVYAGELHHCLNAVAGALLVAILPYSQEAFRTRNRGNCHDFDYEGMSRTWIVGYTLWNWVFVYHTSPVLAGQHLGVLGAALAVGLVEPKRWLQARAYSLGIALFLSFTFPAFLVSRMGTVNWSTAPGDLLCATLSLGFAMTLTIAMVGHRVRDFYSRSVAMDLRTSSNRFQEMSP